MKIAAHEPGQHRTRFFIQGVKCLGIQQSRILRRQCASLVENDLPNASKLLPHSMRAHEYGHGACRIGTVTGGAPGRVTMKTCFGGERIVDMLVGDQLPRIC